jgi:hypothetical protein
MSPIARLRETAPVDLASKLQLKGAQRVEGILLPEEMESDLIGCLVEGDVVEGDDRDNDAFAYLRRRSFRSRGAPNRDCRVRGE